LVIIPTPAMLCLLPELSLIAFFTPCLCITPPEFVPIETTHCVRCEVVGNRDELRWKIAREKQEENEGKDNRNFWRSRGCAGGVRPLTLCANHWH
jgi:hypothetical protein